MYPRLVYDPGALLEQVEPRANFIGNCLCESSTQDRLIQVVRKSIETGIWNPCLQDLDNWSDHERFAALEILVAVVSQWLDDVSLI